MRTKTEREIFQGLGIIRYSYYNNAPMGLFDLSLISVNKGGKKRLLYIT